MSRQGVRPIATPVSIPVALRPMLERIGRLAQTQGLSAYAVGGCVRDWILGGAGTSDVDVTVEGNGIALAQATAQSLGGSVQPHEPFGTATVYLGGGGGRRTHRASLRGLSRVDFASCRGERYARPAAYPTVSAGTLDDDLFRRDFTINAIAVALNPGQCGLLLDPFHGADDLQRKLLRVLHARSFLDDPTRILRGIRFAERFGFRWERRTAAALQEALAAGALGWLNVGRLRRELERMLDEPNPLGCFRHLGTLLEPVS